MDKVAAWSFAAAVGLLTGCNGAPEAPEKTAQQLMAEDVQPTAQIYWDAVRYESTLVDGVAVQRDIRPETDAEWQRTRDAASRLVELANLLKTPAYAAGRNDDWVQFASSLAEAAQRAEQAADARDVDKVFETGGLIYSVCSACHQFYPPAAGIPGEEDPAGTS
jgi:hypothetical protein